MDNIGKILEAVKLYGVEVSDIPVSNLNYEGEENLMARALEGLEKYEVTV